MGSRYRSIGRWIAFAAALLVGIVPVLATTRHHQATQRTTLGRYREIYRYEGQLGGAFGGDTSYAFLVPGDQEVRVVLRWDRRRADLRLAVAETGGRHLGRSDRGHGRIEDVTFTTTMSTAVATTLTSLTDVTTDYTLKVKVRGGGKGKRSGGTTGSPSPSPSPSPTSSPTVSSPPSSPIVTDDSATVPSGSTTSIDVLANDTDPNGNALGIGGVSTPSHGTATISGGQVAYSPGNGYVGADSFGYQACDSVVGACATGRVTVDVQSTTRSITKGLMTSGFGPLPSDGIVQVPTVNVKWSDLEPSDGAIDLSPIANGMAAAQSKGLAGIRLRVMLGINAPSWAKQLGNGPIAYTEPQDGTTGSIPDIWSSAYQSRVERLFAAIAGRFDGDPRLELIFASGGMTVFAEPFIRGVSSAENRSAMLAAGYTKAADQAVESWQLDIMRVFTQTPVGLAYNPWQYINADGTYGSSLAVTGQVMDHQIALFGTRTVLQNNSIRESFISNPPPLYDLFRARPQVARQFQQAGWSRVGDISRTIQWAIDYLGASGVELAGGYDQYLSTAQLRDFDAQLRAAGP